MTFPNFIPTANPFGLVTPPTWFLQRLYAYDPLLVIFPSTCEPCYQMGRRRNRGQGMAKPLEQLPDTKVFYAAGAYPWKRILATTIAGMSWERVLRDLPAFDTERVEDPAGAPDRMEAEDEAALDKLIVDGADQLAADFYRTLGLITGSRVGFGSRPEGAGYTALGTKSRGRRRRVYRPVGAGTGAMFVGR